MADPRADERAIVFLVGAVQFVNILDFMMVSPLGPDFARELGIPLSQLGVVGGSYTASAAVTGVLGSFFLDRFDRRNALAVVMLGLVTATAAGGFATGLGSMVATRVLAGAFGGPAMSLSLSIIADVIPPERRGRAMGAVMGAFSVASVFGVPAGLELARLGGWQTPFFAVAMLGLLVALGAVWLMPPMRLHLGRRDARPTTPLFARPTVLWSLACSAVATASGFVLFPHLATWFMHNAGLPREDLGIFYMVGGALSFGSMRVVGVLVDRFGGAALAAAGTLVFVADQAVTFLGPAPLIPLIATGAVLMIGNSTRNVAMNTVTSRVPAPEERARFVSAQSAVQHGAAAAAAMGSSLVLVELPDHRLGGMTSVVAVSMGLALLLPWLLWRVERAIA